MNCNHAKRDILLSLDGCLPPNRALDLENHLNECADCAEESAEQLKLQQILNLPGRELPDNFEWKLNLQLNRSLYNREGHEWIAEPQQRRWYKLFVPYFVTSFSVAALVAFVLVSDLSQQNEIPIFSSDNGQNLASLTPVSSTAGNTDRLTLGTPAKSSFFSNNNRVGSSTVSNHVADYKWKQKSWSGKELEDLRTITSLRNQNKILSAALKHAQLENENLKELLQTQKID